MLTTSTQAVIAGRGARAPNGLVRALCTGLVVALVACTHGPERDASAFNDAVVLENNRILFSYQVTRYRPPTGLNTIPDGGVALYTMDDNVLGLYDPSSGQVTIGRRQRNTAWSEDHGHMRFIAARGAHAIVRQEGQDRAGAWRSVDELVDVHDWSFRPFPSSDRPTSQSASNVEIFLVSPDGHALLRGVDWSVPNGADKLVLRYPDGSRESIGDAAERPITHGVRGREIIYFDANGRLFRAFDIYTKVTRTMAVSVPPGPDSVEALAARSTILRPGPDKIEREVPGSGAKYEPTGLTADLVRRALQKR